MQLIRKIRNILGAPFPTFNSSKDKWLFIVFISVFVVVFLLTFQPFGVNNFDPTNTIDQTFLLSMLGFGFVIAITLAFFEFVITPLLFKQSNVSTFILKLITELMVIAGTVYLYYNYLGGFHDWSIKSYFSFVFNISVMSIIPIAIMLLFYNYRSTKQAYHLLELQPKLSLSESYINLKSGNAKESISLTLNDLLYIEAQDNYVSIHYLDKGKLRSKLLRATMKDIEEHLASEHVLRCHRSYIVNMNKVNKVIRAGHQLKLYIPELTMPIIASRSFIPQISAFLDTHHK